MKVLVECSQSPFLVVCFFGMWSLTVIILLSIGKQNIWFLNRSQGLQLFPPSAVLVAQLYPHKQIDPLVTYIRSHVSDYDSKMDSRHVFPLDILIDRYSQINFATLYLYIPNQFQHIGRFSSNNEKNQGSFKFMKSSQNFPNEDNIF